MKVTVQNFDDDDGKRKAKWMVRFYEGSKPVRKFFSTRDEAERYATEIRESIPDRRGNYGKATPLKKHGALRHIRMALRALGIEHTLPNIEARIPKEREIDFFSIDEVKKILSAARSHERGLVAILVFVGIGPKAIQLPDRHPPP
jgi:integrase